MSTTDAVRPITDASVCLSLCARLCAQRGQRGEQEHEQRQKVHIALRAVHGSYTLLVSALAGLSDSYHGIAGGVW